MYPDIKNKKIGIWGFGIVGKSAFDFIKQYTSSIQILDKQKQELPNWIEQNQNNINFFLEHNDYIIASPGIPLHAYQNFHYKFITELDIFQQEFKQNVIAITGTLGKTTITKLLAQAIPDSIATGNLGYAMLKTVTDKPHAKHAILELSSFQLQYTKLFQPDLCIWTNFYPNHLDHHLSEKEYFEAKCKILVDQKPHQKALIPCDLIKRIQAHFKTPAQIYLFCTQQCSSHLYPTYKIKEESVLLESNNDHTIIHKGIKQLPSITFLQNWLTIIAAMHLQNLSLSRIDNLLPAQAQEHRVEHLGTHAITTFYNDSKSTIWQSTKQAIKSLPNEPCALFLGGLSKGTDRSPLIQYLATRKITVFAFGKEASLIYDLCVQHKVPCHSFNNLTLAFQAFTNVEKKFKQALLSPAGSSFDLFKNYIERGNYFKQLVKQLQKNP